MEVTADQHLREGGVPPWVGGVEHVRVEKSSEEKKSGWPVGGWGWIGERKRVRIIMRMRMK